MSYLHLNKDNSIKDIESEPDKGGIEIDHDLLEEVAKNKFGHKVFDFSNGCVTFNKERYDNEKLEKEKREYIDYMIDEEIRLIAKKNLKRQIEKVNSVTDIKSLRKLRGG